MNLCIMGTGNITKMMLPAFKKSTFFHCYAVLSRKEETGKALAAEFGIPVVYTDMDQMLADPAIDIVYVASPNNIHYTQTKAALLAGKHVICEKPFVPTLAEAEELISLAQEKGLYLFEAITTAHHPHYAYIKENLPKLGKLKLVNGTFCQYSSRYPALLEGKISHILSHESAGGALMDINMYNIHFAVGLFGAPKNVRYFANIHETGVDTSGVVILEYNGFLCQCVGAKDCNTANSVQVMGEDGHMVITPTASNPQNLSLTLRGKETTSLALPENAWYYEVMELGRLLEAGDYEACCRAMETTRIVVDVLEKARKDAGFNF